MKNLIFFIIIFVLFSACKSTNSSLLIGKWKAVSLKNPAMDREIAKAIIYIENFAKDDADMKEAINIDSFKEMRKQMMNNDIAEQKKALQEMTYTFSERGIAYINDGAIEDSAMWTIENKNILKVDAPALTGLGDLQLFTIQSLSKNQLVLQMAVGVDTSEMILEKIK